jgi:hypothetical protein
MVEQVNQKLSKEQQFLPVGWYLSKTLRLHREYRNHYPDGSLLLNKRVAIALMFICLFICGWALSLFSV